MNKKIGFRAITVALFIGLIAGVTFKATDKKEIKHFTAFFSVEGDNIDPDNDIKQLIAEQIGAECEETWLVGQDKGRCNKFSHSNPGNIRILYWVRLRCMRQMHSFQ